MYILANFVNLLLILCFSLVVDTGFVKTRFITSQTGVEMLKVSEGGCISMLCYFVFDEIFSCYHIISRICTCDTCKAEIFIVIIDMFFYL